MSIQYWWVNHKQTHQQEIDGKYLWSPKTKKNGSRNIFYDNMRRALPGDYVFSYAFQQVAYVGRVVDFAFTAPKPEEFGTAGSNWNKEGWLLPVFWVPLEPAVRPKDIFEKLRPLLPDLYSPLSLTTGNGNQGAYLAEISEHVFHEVMSVSAFDALLLKRGGANSLKFEVVTEMLDDAVEESIKKNIRLDDTIRDALVKARRGQGKFRSNVEKIEQSCRLTGVTNPLLLIASHIKPWRLCETADERLDGNNGLMLSPDADHLFDRGFVSFDESGDPLVSKRIPSIDLQRLGLEHLSTGFSDIGGAGSFALAKGFSAEQQGYLEFHRSEVFIA